MKKNYNYLLFIVVIIWGGGYSATEYLIKASYGTSLINTLRFLIATILLFLIFSKKILRISKDEIKFGFISGLFMFLGFYTQTLAQKYTNLSNVAFFTATGVIMLPFVSYFFTKKKPTISVILISFVALLGSLILNYKGQGISFNKGDFLALSCALFFTLQICYLDYATKKSDTVNINFSQMFFSFVFSLTTLIVTRENIVNVNYKEGFISIIYLGVFSTFICYLIQTFAQKYTDAVTTGIILSLEAVMGSIFSIILGFEIFSLSLLIGGSLIILSSILINIYDYYKEKNNKKLRM
ncbi:DMT family transporter [Oceanivirga miroungae]|uniref:EamA domain-containing protein n=1 Tax=Oceanivirga miroungae TaxID=1130046 RepID=A0A6I8M8M3_9FUSO|nr:DMT family transporter [Oceanivirga miroungae]VWL85164.1 hypothetical protein OMES3154_00448 [Oceanivirga miroungae]